MPNVNNTQTPHLSVIPGGTVPVNVTEAVHLSVVDQGAPVNATQVVFLTVSDQPVGVEYVPELGSTFGPILWVEFDSGDGTTKVWAMADLPDDPSYYHGMKDGLLVTAGVVARALSSDDDGSYEGQSFTVEIADLAYMRTLLGQTDLRRVIISRKMRVRMIDLAGWRAQSTPRTVAMGLVRGYTTG